MNDEYDSDLLSEGDEDTEEIDEETGLPKKPVVDDDSEEDEDAM